MRMMLAAHPSQSPFAVGLVPLRIITPKMIAHQISFFFLLGFLPC
jgi:hypothetical protein